MVKKASLTHAWSWIWAVGRRLAAHRLGWDDPANSSGNVCLHRVKFYGGIAKLPDTAFTIKYITDDSWCPVWTPVDAAKTCLTLLHSESGTGKSTFLNQFYRYMRFREQERDGLEFDFDPDLTQQRPVGIGFVPQNPPTVNHWEVREILPQASVFLTCFFDSEEVKFPADKRLGQFSGGQRQRLYACSAIERLATLNDHACFLLLDETFDGLGPKGLSACVSSFRTRWTEKNMEPLHILLVTHIPLNQIAGCEDALRLTLATVEITSEQYVVRIRRFS